MQSRSIERTGAPNEGTCARKQVCTNPTAEPEEVVVEGLSKEPVHMVESAAPVLRCAIGLDEARGSYDLSRW